MTSPARLLDFTLREDGPAYDATPTRRHVTVIEDDVLDAIGTTHGATALAVYVALARMVNRDGQCWPSEDTLGERVCLSGRQVRRVIATRLVPGGYVVKAERKTKTGMTVGITYTLPHHRKADSAGVDIGLAIGVDKPSAIGVDTSAPEVVRSREEVAGSIPPSAGSAPKPERKPLPTNGPAQTLLAAWADATGVLPVNYRKAVGQAQALVRAGVTAADVPDLVAYLRGEAWLGGAFDLGTALSQADKFRAARLAIHRPAPPVPPSRMSRGERQSAEREADRARLKAAIDAQRQPPRHDDADVFDIGGRITP